MGGEGGGVSEEAQLSAHHLCVLLVPVVIAHRPPDTVVEDLHPPFRRGGAAHQPDGVARGTRWGGGGSHDIM